VLPLLPEEEGGELDSGELDSGELDSKLNCRVFCWTGVGCSAGGTLSLEWAGV
jgi:hypothetical protein